MTLFGILPVRDLPTTQENADGKPSVVATLYVLSKVKGCTST
ncbi:hypothetical protein [Rheinheimera soli]|uniref:Uncharacterized protein n=1 Tax=Rheinheimera soli TaxID=443616 RepID=A0ABU1W1R6_9GAMM|nr:hypothetical protein [Rheinheimera soli]MDR7121891.1 hypothetical protein [Rheinheimera soli]